MCCVHLKFIHVQNYCLVSCVLYNQVFISYMSTIAAYFHNYYTDCCLR